MATPATIVALLNAARRRRTPRLVRVEADVAPDGSLQVTFDRPMDAVPAGGGMSTDVRAVFRLFDGVNGDIITYGEDPGNEWTDDRTLSLAESDRSSGYVGPTYCVYLGGNIKALGRFFLDNRSRTDAVEFI